MWGTLHRFLSMDEMRLGKRNTVPCLCGWWKKKQWRVTEAKEAFKAIALTPCEYEILIKEHDQNEFFSAFMRSLFPQYLLPRSGLFVKYNGLNNFRGHQHFGLHCVSMGLRTAVAQGLYEPTVIRATFFQSGCKNMSPFNYLMSNHLMPPANYLNLYRTILSYLPIFLTWIEPA